MLSYWKGLELEVDKMDYGFGTSYEIECESSDPDRAKEMLEEFLNGNSIKYSYFEGSKVCCFLVSEAASASVRNFGFKIM